MKLRKMMSAIILVILTIILLVGCSEKKVADIDLICPGEEAFKAAVSTHAKDVWTVVDEPKWEPEKQGFKEIYNLVNNDKSLTCYFAIDDKDDARRFQLSLKPYEGTKEMQKRYQETELPALLGIVSELATDKKEMKVMCDNIAKKYDEYVKNHPQDYLVRFGEQHAGIFGDFELFAPWEDSKGSELPLFNYMRFGNRKSYTTPYAPKEGTVKTIKGFTEDVQSQFKKINLVKGKISKITLDDSLSKVKLSANSGLSLNLYDFRKGTLTDESGEIEVYIAPSAWSDEDLSGEMYHSVLTLENGETLKPVFIVRMSKKVE